MMTTWLPWAVLALSREEERGTCGRAWPFWMMTIAVRFDVLEFVARFQSNIVYIRNWYV